MSIEMITDKQKSYLLVLMKKLNMEITEDVLYDLDNLVKPRAVSRIKTLLQKVDDIEHPENREKRINVNRNRIEKSIEDVEFRNDDAREEYINAMNNPDRLFKDIHFIENNKMDYKYCDNCNMT